MSVCELARVFAKAEKFWFKTLLECKHRASVLYKREKQANFLSADTIMRKNNLALFVLMSYLILDEWMGGRIHGPTSSYPPPVGCLSAEDSQFRAHLLMCDSEAFIISWEHEPPARLLGEDHVAIIHG